MGKTFLLSTDAFQSIGTKSEVKSSEEEERQQNKCHRGDNPSLCFPKSLEKIFWLELNTLKMFKITNRFYLTTNLQSLSCLHRLYTAVQSI